MTTNNKITNALRDNAEITKYASTMDSFPSKAGDDIKVRRAAFKESNLQITVPRTQRVNVQINVVPTHAIDAVLPNKSLRGDAFRKFLADMATDIPQDKPNAARDALEKYKKTNEGVNASETPHTKSTDSKKTESTISSPSPVKKKVLHGKELQAFLDARTISPSKTTESEAPKPKAASQVAPTLIVKTDTPKANPIDPAKIAASPITKAQEVVQQTLQQKAPAVVQLQYVQQTQVPRQTPPVQQVQQPVHQNTNELGEWFKEFRYTTPYVQPQVVQPRVILQNPNYLAGWFSEFPRR